MSEERIQEIKDSINFQYELIVSKGINKNALLFTDEEQELLEEVERLNNIIKEVKEYIEKYLQDHIIEDHPDEQSIFYDENDYYIPNAKEVLLAILKGE